MTLRFKYMERVTFIVGLSIRAPKESASKRWFYVGLIRVSFIMLTVLSFMCYFNYDQVSKAGASWKSVALLCATHLRNWPSMAFLLYWQLSGDLESIYALFEHEILRRLVPRSLLRRADICISALVVSGGIGHLSARIWALAHNLSGFKPTAELTIGDPFGLPYGMIGWTLLWTYQLFAGTLALGYQAITMIGIKRAFENHNNNLVRLECSASTSAEALARLLEQRTDEQIELNRALFVVNTTFKVYTLVLTLLTVPRLIVTAWYAQSFYTAVNISGAVVETLTTMSSLIVLVVLPSLIHSKIKDSEAILCRNHRIWSPYNVELGHLARNLVQLTKQHGLGISLGGVTVITATLIWTLTSLLITILTIFHELRSTPYSLEHPGTVFANSTSR